MYMHSFLKSVLIGAVLSVSALASAANSSDPAVGTWTMNPAKSKLPTGHEVKSMTRVYTQSGDGVSLKVTGVAADGSAISQSATLNYDGKPYPITGAADYDALSLKKINGSTVKSTLLKDGKPVGSSVRTISMHGKLLTLKASIKGKDGKTYQMLTVFDKE